MTVHEASTAETKAGTRMAAVVTAIMTEIGTGKSDIETAATDGDSDCCRPWT